MDQIFDTDAPGCVNNVSPLGPGMSWKSTSNSSGQDSIQKMINNNYNNNKNSINHDNNHYRTGKKDYSNDSSNKINLSDDNTNILKEANRSNSYDYCDDIEKNENEKYDKQINIYNKNNLDNDNDNNNMNRDKIDLMTMNPLLANVFEEDEDDGENIDLA